jgi:DNA-binding response OmpR family regulator
MAEIILVVDDEPSLQETLAYNLKKQGYTIEIAKNGITALETARWLKPDLILLDIMLPGLDGVEVCKTLRREGFQAPIIMLTARDSELDRVIGLEIGADDYLAKPFSMRELLARIKAQLRRTLVIREELEKLQTDTGISSAQISVHKFGNLTINKTRREISLNNLPLSIKPMEYDLLVFLSDHKGQLLSRAVILERVWGWDYIGDTRTVDVHMRWLRLKIEADPANPTRIVTVRGGGYRFEG